ncbi:MAG: GAF domain-containing protein [Candidatus Rokuibacteriota bacterium]|nr:MAG: GAF domain-containing protein [Candidatus Rokubacteria bacterium]
MDVSLFEYRAILHHPTSGSAGRACYNNAMLSLSQSFQPGSADLQAALHGDPNGFPFKSELSLAPLLAFWAKKFGDDTSAKGTFVRMVREQVKQVPELMAPITDLGVIDRHRQLVELLMAGIFAPAFFEQEFSAVLVPFQLKSFYATPPFNHLLRGEDGTLRGRVNLDPSMVGAMRRFFAYALVLERVYGVDLIVDYPLILTVPDPETGLDRHFKMEFDWRFVEVKPVGAIPTLPDEMRRRLRRDLLDPDLLREVLPPERFVFQGFTIFRGIEVTDQEVLSSLERDLIDKESIVSSTRFRALQAKLRTLFRRPELRFGLAALDGDQVLVLNYGAEGEQACIFADSRHHTVAEFRGSVYERAVVQGRPLIVEDLAEMPDRKPADEDLLQFGLRNIIVAPLLYQGRVIGTLELGSSLPGDLDATHLPKLLQILPLFSMAVQRSMEELNARITAIHPVVEWRFRKAVLKSIEHRAEDAADAGVEIEPIVFERIHPLYALSDIRGSSTQRSLAIQADLLTQLGLARDVIRVAHDAKRLPGLHELLYRVDKHAGNIQDHLHSGDEVSIIAFLRSDVEALFDHIQTFGVPVRERIEAYRAALDPRIGTVYDRRRLFEESVTRVADGISSYLDLEEQTAQTMFPHYFEKQKTDGVDHQIYVGAALLEDGRFDPLYLKSLRLWQLMVTCGIALRAHRLTERLPLPLEVTHLVLVQHAPLAIRFRFDEKRFDVDGAYDIRYEIVKKRIDKALVKGTDERITQPGKIAIVYTQSSEAHEYRGFIEYLQSLGYFTGAVEDIELDDLQGVHGLRALRVTIDLGNPRIARRIALGDLQAATSGSSRN